MKERPILFSGPMVRAILNGRKTQTRRVVKNAPTTIEDGTPNAALMNTLAWSFITCPYGQPGDRRWVRETYLRLGSSCLMEWGEHSWHWWGETKSSVLYCADGDDSARAEGNLWYRKMPSIHMPRWASRLTLEIVSIRVERLNDISEADAKAEGASLHRWFQPRGKPDLDGYTLGDEACYRNGFANLWESINGKGSWNTNPWVWVVEFKVIH